MVHRILLLLLLLGPAACTGGRGHPVRTSLPRLGPDEAPPPAPTGLPEPGLPAGDQVLPLIFLGEPAVLRALQALRQAPSPGGRTPRLVALPDVERALLQRYRGRGPAGPVRRVTAIGTTGRVPLTPEAMADLIEDPEVERQVLAATSFRPRGFVYRVAGQHRRRYWVEMRRVGAGPFRYDLLFGIQSERWTLPDGRIVIRFDPVLRPLPRIVTMYRGGVLLEPDGTGTRITEVLAFGNSLQVPPPIWKVLRPMIEATQRNRSINLWKRAWRGVPREPVKPAR